jgi:hypothetical protein
MKGQIHPRRAGMPITATARNTNHATSAISCTAGTVLAARFLSSRFERTDGVIVRGEIVKDDKGIGLRLFDLTFDRHVCSLLLSSTNG